MNKKIIILALAVYFLISCNNTKAMLYIHTTKVDDGDIFGDPKYGFFYDNTIGHEIIEYKLKFSREEYLEIKKLIEVLKSKKDLDTIELSEAPHNIALIIGKDTLYACGNSKANGWMWKKKVTSFESAILKKKLEEYTKP